MFFFFFFSFIARNFSTLFLSIFQVRDDGANGTHGFAMVLSVIDLNEDPSDLSWFSQGLHLPWFRLFTWLYCVATNFVTSQPLNLLSSYPLILSTSQPPNLPTSQPLNLSTSHHMSTVHGSTALPPIHYSFFSLSSTQRWGRRFL